MTWDEALSLLAAAVPGRTLSIVEQHWLHWRKDENRYHAIDEFRVAVLPGFDGESCSSTCTANTLAEAVNDMVETARTAVPRDEFRREFAAEFRREWERRQADAAR